jgi:hypothetical protein
MYITAGYRNQSQEFQPRVKYSINQILILQLAGLASFLILNFFSNYKLYIKEFKIFKKNYFAQNVFI